MAKPITSQFAATKQLFREYLSGYTFPLSYEEWYTADDDSKAALLFVNFYKEIALAWSKWKTPYFIAEDGVSIAMQIMQKQVSFINSNPKLFTPTYIYRVSWNGLGAFIKSHVTDKRRSELESYCFVNEVDGSGNSISVNLLDLIPQSDDDIEIVLAKDAVWEIIDSLGPKAAKVVNHLINPSDTLRRTSSRRNTATVDLLGDVSVSPAEYAEISQTLYERLSPYKDFFLE